MTDREKVIRGLEYCRQCPIGCQQKCPYKSDFGCRSQLTADALELLKEQEPKAVKIMKNAYNHEFYYCPRCDRGFEDFFRKPMFCDKCGQAVKWDE